MLIYNKVLYVMNMTYMYTNNGIYYNVICHVNVIHIHKYYVLLCYLSVYKSTCNKVKCDGVLPTVIDVI